MKNFGTVTICTQVYNTKSYLKQCIDSVLKQTYANFEYIILDNGCTDGSGEILENYAQTDNRIHLIRYKENQQILWHRIIKEYAAGTYLTFIDSDDWWDANFLERMITFLNHRNLDFAVTGTLAYIEATYTHQIMRKVEQPVYFTPAQFAQQYPQYWAFPSTVWGSISKKQLYLNADIPALFQSIYTYGLDTMIMLQYIKRCANIGIDNSALYHYRIHTKGVSYQYDSRRFDSNIACYEQIKNFLESYHAFDLSKQEWLKRVHMASLGSTLGLLKDAHITDNEKIAECARIVEHPLTAVALTNDCKERKQLYTIIWDIIFSVLTGGKLTDWEILHMILQSLSPQCCVVAQRRHLGLLAKEATLRDALQRDDWEQMVCRLMELIVQRRYSKQFDLGQALCCLVPPGMPLAGMVDARFFREYADICMLILCENYSAALEQMTGLLLEEEKLYSAEVFLNLYLSLSALEEHVPAFLFGKQRLAWLYLKQDRREECQAVADELTKMGLDSEALSELRRSLEGTL